jgi:mannose-6-phosphate isomerase
MINSSDNKKPKVFQTTKLYIKKEGFDLEKSDFDRTFRGFFLNSENQVEIYSKRFFTNINLSNFQGFEKLWPKILAVDQHPRLSLQYQHRRSEIWTVITGHTAIVRSQTSEENEQEQLPFNTIINLKQ